jgi:hypothetical protein
MSYSIHKTKSLKFNYYNQGFFFLQKCQLLCSALTYGPSECDVYYFYSPFCYLGNQNGLNKIYSLSANEVTAGGKQWILLASQTAGAWFSKDEWSTIGDGKLAILNQIENYRLVGFGISTHLNQSVMVG